MYLGLAAVATTDIPAATAVCPIIKNELDYSLINKIYIGLKGYIMKQEPTHS